MKKLKQQEKMTMSKWFNDVFEIRETKDGSKLFIKGPESLEDIDAIYAYLKAGIENGGAAFFLDKKLDKLKKSHQNNPYSNKGDHIRNNSMKYSSRY